MQTSDNISLRKPWPTLLKVAGAAALLAAAAGIATPASSSSQKSPASPPESPASLVRVDTVGTQQASPHVKARGRVEPSQVVRVRSEVDGIIRRLRVREGAAVKAGDVLAELSDDVYRARRQVARANLARAHAALGSARRHYDRSEALVQKGVDPSMSADDSRTNLALREAELRVSRAALNLANIDLRRTRIRAPIDGRAGRRLIDVGNSVRVAEGRAILEIAKLDPVWVMAAVPGERLGQLRRALRDGTARVEIFDLGGGPSLGSGQVDLLGDEIEQASGTIAVRVVVANAEARLWPGQPVRVRIATGRAESATFVPEEALFRSAKGDAVYVVGADASAALRPVEVVDREAGRVWVRGVAAGDKVVVVGQSGVTPGGRVKVLDVPATH